MKRLSQFSCKFFILMCLVYSCADGFSIGRTRLKKSIQRRIEKNGFDVGKSLENLNSGYQYISNFWKNYQNGDPQEDGEKMNPKASLGSSALSGVANCDDCFLGMQVSRREASVVSSKSMILALIANCLLGHKMFHY